MRQVLIRRGRISVESVPAPLVESGHVLVEVAYSLISTGTEMSAVQTSGKSLAAQFLEEPGRVKQLVDHLRRRGIQKTVGKVQAKRTSAGPTGYSCSGIVVQVGEGVGDLAPGDRVACAGAGIANHAELVLVPRNLVVKVPDGCSLRSAASVTLGAVAMQGLRRVGPRLGEIVAVIGLGLLGQLTVQLLKASGCRVVGFDLHARRVAIALKSGADHAFVPSEVDILNEVRQISADHGVDATIVTAATRSDAVVQQAMEITRKKGRVVVVGDVGLRLRRSPLYEKEIDFLISCSYGPGRYDERYEKRGLDYPYEWVRWTESRNMDEYLRLVAEHQVDLDLILEREYDLAEAPQAFEELRSGADNPLGVLLRYALDEAEAQVGKLATKVVLRTAAVNDRIGIAVVGAGDFAKSMHLPNLRKLSGLYHIRAIVTATGSNAVATSERFGADYASTSYEDVLTDPEVAAVLICTRHHLHAQQATKAAEAGKAIFLEKPMALNKEELDQLSVVLGQTGVPFMVGFNRRFSPAARRAREVLSGHRGPLMILYRVNAGYIPPDNWVHTEEGGGRIIGEACHMFDLFQYLVSPARVVEVSSTAIVPHAEHVSARDNTVVTLRYDDGSVGTLFYTAMGSARLNKEYVEIYCDGRALAIDDYRTLTAYGGAEEGWASRTQDKGHLEELRAFAGYVRAEGPPPIPLDSLIEVTEVSLVAAGVSNGIG
jgi:predicted dehydrogenase/threonine dehydrogenase-like Zn-dependent dehydrogenase